MATSQDLLNADLNLSTLDGFVTSGAASINDRLGNAKLTLSEIQRRSEAAVAAAGFIPAAGSFESGGTITAPNQVLLRTTAPAAYFSWGGALPKVVPASSTVAGTGGEGVTAWTNRNDATLAAALAATDSTVLVGGVEAKDLSNRYKNSVSVEDFGALGDGVSDDAAAFQNALNAGKGLVLSNSSKTYAIFSPLIIPDGLVFDLGGARVSKQFNGNLFSRVGKRALISRGVFLGNGNFFSGAGFIVDQGSASSFDELGLQIFEYCIFKDFRNYSIDYPTGNLGTFSQIRSCFFIPLPVSLGGVGVSIRWPDDFPANNGNRQVVDCYSADTLLSIGNTQNGVIRNNTVGVPDTKPSIVFSGNPLKLIVQGNRFAHGLNLFTIKGQEHVFSSNILPSQVAFDPTCTNVSWCSDNIFSGFNGNVPYSTNSIETSTEIAFTPSWTSSGIPPNYGDSDVRGSYSVRGKMVRGQVAIIFGASATFGTGDYSFSLPLIPATLTKKYSSSAWVQGFPCSTFVDPNAANVQLYQPNGTVVTATGPTSLTSGSTILFEFCYEIG